MRRRAVLFGVLATPGIARAQQQQQRPLRIVVPYPPGGGADLLARALGGWVSQRHHRSVVVENRPGASGTIGAAFVARAAPDGETVLQADFAGMTIQPLVNRLTYTHEDFVPVARLVTNAVFLAAAPALGITGVSALVARAKAQPGTLTYATPGLLSHLHVAMEAFCAAARITLVHVPYQGTAPGVTAALAGQVDLIALPPGALGAGVGERHLVPLAVMAAQREPGYPRVPTLREAGLDVVFDGWRGLFAPRGTPRSATEIWERAAFDAPQDPIFAQRLSSLGERAAPLDPDGFARFWAADRAMAEALLPRLPRG